MKAQKTIDLHTHSNYSDGTLSPAGLVAHALKRQLSAIALTDHDTVDGITEAVTAAAGTSLELIPGIEFSTEYQGYDIHIVGLDVDCRSAQFLQELAVFRDSRTLRNEKMIARMRADHIDISTEQMRAAFGDAVWTRAHFARYLFEHGYAASLAEAFARYVGEHCRYFVPREKVTPAQAVDLITRTGGIAVLAHPLLGSLDEPALDRLIVSLKNCGLIALEAYYATYTPAEEAYALRLAQKHALLPSGGSDFHGSNKPDIELGSGRGNLALSYDILQHLRDRRTSYEYQK